MIQGYFWEMEPLDRCSKQLDCGGWWEAMVCVNLGFSSAAMQQ